MNCETEKLLRQLEQATSHTTLDSQGLDNKDLDKRDLDPETRALHEGWLAFDRVLQSLENGPSVQPVRSPSSSRVLKRPHWVMTVSVVLFVAVICGSFLLIRADRLDGNKSIIAQGAASEDATVLADGVESDRAMARQNTELAWDDSFDHRLAAASLALRRAGEGREVYQWHYLRDELHEISDELTHSSL